MKIDKLYAICDRHTDMRRMDGIIDSLNNGVMNKDNFFQFAHEHLVKSNLSDKNKKQWDDLLQKTYKMLF